jgi:hypothetical protein
VDPLEQLIRDLIRLGVGMEVKGGQPVLTLPGREPARSNAERASRAGLELLRGDRGRVLKLWPELAAGTVGPPPDGPARCRECRAWVFGVTPARADRLTDDRAEYLGWAFCESLCCPYRTDGGAGRHQQRHLPPHWKRTWRERHEGQVRRRAVALGSDLPPPLPE